MAIKLMGIDFTEQINPIRKLEQSAGVRILVRYRGGPVGWADVNHNPRVGELGLVVAGGVR